MSFFFHEIFFRPLYNALAVLSGFMPGHDLGLAIVVLTILVKLLLWPLYRQAQNTQQKLKKIEPAIKKLKEQHKNNQVEQGRALVALYKENGIHPLAGFLPILIQIPIVLALYFVFRETNSFPHLVELYPFIKPPQNVESIFLGFLDIGAPSRLLALLTGLGQFWQAVTTIPKLPPRAASGGQNLTDDLSRSLQLQMKYVMPVIIALISLKLPAALPLYWLTSSLVMIGQFYADRRFSSDRL